MSITDKEGKVYKISGPNKLAKAQVSWDIKKLVFHNFNWPEIRTSADKKITKNKIKIKENIQEIKQPEVPIAISEEQISYKESQYQEIKEPEYKETQEPEQETKKETLEFELPMIKYKVLMHCLPAERKSYQDNLYGESWTKVTYKKKFIFPAVIIDNEDLFMTFWSSDPKEKITLDSIVYPFVYEVYEESTDSYNRVPYNQHRWWKIVEKENKDIGWIYKAIPSDNQPDFSD